jgi:hypothetical protein
MGMLHRGPVQDRFTRATNNEFQKGLGALGRKMFHPKIVDGQEIRLEIARSMTSGTWLPVVTNKILSSGLNTILPLPSTNRSDSFYRAVWLP